MDAVFNNDSAIGPDPSFVETILIKAAEMMGHSEPRSLRPYLTYVLNRRIQTADITKRENLAVWPRQMRLQEGTRVRRLRHNQDLYAAGKLIEAVQSVDASATLWRIVDELG